MPPFGSADEPFLCKRARVSADACGPEDRARKAEAIIYHRQSRWYDKGP